MVSLPLRLGNSNCPRREIQLSPINGASDEHEAPTNTGRGLVWRLYSISRFEQRDGGVYVELEAVALSRDIPTGLRWAVDPIVRRTSKASIHASLANTVGAVLEVNRVAKNKNENATAASALLHETPAARVQSGLLP